MVAITGGQVTITNVGAGSLQGDARFCHVLARMGCDVTQTGSCTIVSRQRIRPLQAVDLDLNDMTDTFLTLAACAAMAHGTTFIRNISNQRVKECDRIEVKFLQFYIEVLMLY